MLQVDIDSLTGAFARSTLGNQLRKWLEFSQSGGFEFSVVFIDLDYFKSINDAFGHSRGDQVLIEVVNQIKNNIRNQDQVFRYGGDEFVVLLPGSPKAQAVKIVERIRHVITTTAVGSNPPVYITASYGLATFPEDSNTPEGLFEVMDRRVYQSKALGRGRIVSEELEILPTIRFNSPQRMVERDLEYQQGQIFFRQFQEKGSGILEICGQPGMGRTRLMAELAKLARLQGLAVWSITTTPAMRFRKGSVLSDLLSKVGLTVNAHHAVDLAEALGSWVRDKGLGGLLLSIDKVENIDSHSLGLLKSLLGFPLSFHLGLLFSSESAADFMSSFSESCFKSRIDLNPLSEQGLRIWLRYSMGWEAPDSFVHWLARCSQGLPQKIQAALQWLNRQGLLRLEGDHWFTSDLDENLITAFLQDLEIEKKITLPELRTELIGREAEIWQIKQISQNNNFFTICGPDGIGKSRLALQAAWELQDSFEDGVLWFSLQERQTREDLLIMLLRAWNYQVQVLENQEDELFRLYQDKSVLLVFDNIIPSSEAAMLVTRMAEKLKGIVMIITSVLPLGFLGEQVLGINGLSIPDKNLFEKNETYSAVSLFLSTARQALANFQPESQDWDEIIRICRQVEGLPLGIELAAAWVSIFTCAQIADRIEENIQFLGSNPGRNQLLESRHHVRSISAVLDGLWNVFSENEQQVLYALSVFHPGFSTEAAAQVANASPFFLDALIAKKMLHVILPQRYMMHLLLAQYASSQFSLNREIERHVLGRYTSYFLQLLEKKTPLLSGGLDPDGTVAQDLGNFRSAWENAVKEKAYGLLLGSVDGIFYLYYNLGQFYECIRLLTLCLESLPADSDDIIITRLSAGLLSNLGELYFHTGQYSLGVPLLQRAAQILHQLNEPADEAEVLRSLANLVGAMGKYDEAIELLNQGVDLVRDLDDLHLKFNLLNRAGVMGFFKKDYDQANRYFESCLEIARKIGDHGKISVILNNQGNIAYQRGDLEHGKELLVESLSLCRMVDRVTLQASVLDTLAKIMVGLHDDQKGTGYFIEALQLVRDVDAVPLALEILLGVAELWHARGKDDLARELLSYVQAFPNVPNDIVIRGQELDAHLGWVDSSKITMHWGHSSLRRVIVDVCQILAAWS